MEQKKKNYEGTSNTLHFCWKYIEHINISKHFNISKIFAILFQLLYNFILFAVEQIGFFLVKAVHSNSKFNKNNNIRPKFKHL